MALPDRWITDTRVSTRYPVYTRANAGEVLPEPASPLGWTLVFAPGVNEGWRDCQIRVGTCDPDEVTADEVTGLFGGRLYINASLARLFGVRGPGLSAEMVDQAYFGEHPDVPPYVPEPWHESAAATERLAAWMGSVLMAPDLDVLLDDRAEAERVRAERPDLSSATDAELVERARSLVPLVRRLFDRHLEMTAGTSIGTGVLAQVAAAVGDPTLPLTLITSVGDVDSALPSHEMWALSRLDRSSPEYRSGFSSFVERHGSRGPNEWDIHSETWETEPALAEALIDVMRSAPDDADPARRDAVNTAAREEAAARVHEVLADQPELLATFETGLRSAHLYLAGRERAKTTIISVVHEIRMAVRELGQRYDYPLDVITMLLADELE
ncbi:MAG: hypothetical protein MUE78_02465, partial [Ilumatobacteraceae bacterium]|nr:hypothetical protein [Ilumatobacteraceae bacterium]